MTLIDGNDIIWTCLQGGVAARLAVRHMSLFDDADSRLLPTQGADRVNKTLQFWRRPRRAIMDTFARAIVDEANYLMRQTRDDPLSPVPVPISKLAAEATRTFARARALVLSKGNLQDREINTLLSVVVSSVSHNLLMNVPGQSDILPSIVNEIFLAEPNADTFQDQSGLQPPDASSYGSTLNKATWASRRIALSVSRSMVVGSGAADVIEKLSALDVSDSCGATAITRLYYCPMGGRIEALPNRMPFAVDNLGSRLVWMEVLSRKAAVLAQALADNADRTGQTVDGPLFIEPVPLSGDPGDVVPSIGLGRHPLVIEHAGTTIRVPVSSNVNEPSTEPDDNKSDSLIDVLTWLRTEEDTETPYVIRAHVRRMRTIAFNAERFLFAVALARATEACEPRLQARLHSVDQVLSFALALAMLEVEMGSLPAEISVYTDEVARRVRTHNQSQHRQRRSFRAVAARVRCRKFPVYVDNCNVSLICKKHERP